MTVTKSFSVEFDDALLDLDGWKNPRYDGSKLTGQKINEYNNGDVTYGKNPVITNKTVALYIGNTLIGGEDEDEQYAYIKKHSYININRILIINPETDELTLLDASQEGFDSFHRFVTNDLPTGGSFNIRLLDYSIPNILSADAQNYVKMNKGWLLKSFKYVPLKSDNASLYHSGSANGNPFTDSSQSLALLDSVDFTQAPSDFSDNVRDNTLVFLYGNKKADPTDLNEDANDVHDDFSPSYVNSSIISNKFTDRYYTGSYTLPTKNVSGYWLGSSASGAPHEYGAFTTANKFIGIDTLNYLRENTNVELHLTLFQGTKDYAPGLNDERSISTFEIDRKQAIDYTSSFLNDGPTFPLLLLKGRAEGPFRPTLSPIASASNTDYLYLSTVWQHALTNGGVQKEVSTRITANSYAVNEPIGGFNTSDYSGLPYSGSDNTTPFDYELSFLDKSHTLIADIDKESSLPNGIGEKGFVIIPQQLDKRVKLNIDYYLSKAGLIDETFTKIT